MAHLILKNLRISFPSLWNADVKGEVTFGMGATFVIDPDKDAKALAAIEAAIKTIKSEKPKIAAVVKKKPDNVCLREGDRDEYGEGMQMLKANTPKRPVIMFNNGTRCTDENDDPIYSGCYVNVKVEIWGQDNQYGKRINAKLIAVQFAAEGESFDGSHVSEDTAMEGFESLDGDFDGVGDDDLGLD